MTTLLIIALVFALALFVARGYCEYIVTATGAAPGWRIPAWVSRERDDARRAKAGLPPRPGWMFWRDSYHLFQALRSFCHSSGDVLALLAGIGVVTRFWSLETSVIITLTLPIAVMIALFLVGHGIGYSLVMRLYNK